MKYYICKKTNFYGPSEKFGWIEDEDSYAWGFTALEFDSLAAAREWIKNWEKEVYHLSHNESGRPEFKVLSEEDAWEFNEVLKHQDMGSSCYSWDHCKDPENPTEKEVKEACAKAEEDAWNSINSL